MDGSPKMKRSTNSLIKGIEHIAIASPNPPRLAKWYIEHLNLELILDSGNTIYVKSADSVVLEFIKADNELLRPQTRDAGLRHIAFSVDDLESARATLQSAGVTFESKPVGLPGMRLHFFRDLEGNLLHLIEREEKLRGTL